MGPASVSRAAIQQGYRDGFRSGSRVRAHDGAAMATGIATPPIAAATSMLRFLHPRRYNTGYQDGVTMAPRTSTRTSRSIPTPVLVSTAAITNIAASTANKNAYKGEYTDGYRADTGHV